MVHTSVCGCLKDLLNRPTTNQPSTSYLHRHLIYSSRIPQLVIFSPPILLILLRSQAYMIPKDGNIAPAIVYNTSVHLQKHLLVLTWIYVGT